MSSVNEPGSEPVVTLDVLDRYLRENISRYLPESLRVSERDKIEIIERIVRVEEGLKAQGERIEMLIHQMDKRFEEMAHQMDRRFEEMAHQMDRRFEQVDKRFNLLQWLIGLGVTLIVALMSIYEFIS